MRTQQTTFERFEYKYWVSDSVASELLRLCAAHLGCDDWAPGGQHNTSLYLDSPELDFARLHAESAPDRFKLRVRAYGDPPVGPVFFEIKRKIKAVIWKRRTVVPIAALREILDGGMTPRLKSAEEERTLAQFLYLKFVYRAEPRVLINCRRQAFTSIDQSAGVRLTLDRDIRYQPVPAHKVSLDGDRHAWIHLCGRGNDRAVANTLIELKFRGAAPLWVQDVVQRLGLVRCNFSKYVAAVACEELALEDFLSADLATTQPAFRTKEAA